jgi:hypothetical protein
VIEPERGGRFAAMPAVAHERAALAACRRRASTARRAELDQRPSRPGAGGSRSWVARGSRTSFRGLIANRARSRLATSVVSKKPLSESGLAGIAEEDWNRGELSFTPDSSACRDGMSHEPASGGGRTRKTKSCVLLAL